MKLPEVPLRGIRGSDGVQRVWRGFRELVAVKWVKHPGEPMTFSRAFASTWCGVTPGVVQEAMEIMRESGIRGVGKTSAGGRQATLWLPVG